MTKRSDRLKVFVTGPYQSGKTRLIKTLDPDALTIERPMLRPHRGEWGTTTTAFDLGHVVRLTRGTERLILSKREYNSRKSEFTGWHATNVELRGVPGALQFRSVRDSLRDNSDAILMVVDASDPDMLSEAREILEETQCKANGTPIHVIANKQDRVDAFAPQEVAKWLGVSEAVGISAKDCVQCRNILLHVIERAEKTMSEKTTDV